MTEVSIKPRPLAPEAIYKVRFLGNVDVFPKTPEEAVKMNFKYGQMYSWGFQYVDGKFANQPVSGLTPMTWSPNNKMGKWIVVLKGEVKENVNFKLDSLGGREANAHIIIRTSGTGNQYNSIKELFPLGEQAQIAPATAQQDSPPSQPAPEIPQTTTQPPAQGALTPSADVPSQPAPAAPEKKKEEPKKETQQINTKKLNTISW